MWPQLLKRSYRLWIMNWPQFDSLLNALRLLIPSLIRPVERRCFHIAHKSEPKRTPA